MKRTLLCPLLALALAGPGLAAAQSLDGEQLYKQRCAHCHDSGAAPARVVLSHKPRAAIVQALTSGVMKPQAGGLKPHDIAMLATYLVGPKKPAAGRR